MVAAFSSVDRRQEDFTNQNRRPGKELDLLESHGRTDARCCPVLPCDRQTRSSVRCAGREGIPEGGRKNADARQDPVCRELRSLPLQQAASESLRTRAAVQTG